MIYIKAKLNLGWKANELEGRGEMMDLNFLLRVTYGGTIFWRCLL